MAVRLKGDAWCWGYAPHNDLQPLKYGSCFHFDHRSLPTAREMGVIFASLGNLVYEVFAIRARDSAAAEAACHCGDAMHVSFGDHSFRDAIDVVVDKSSFYVPIKERPEIKRLAGIARRHACLSVSR